MDQNKFVDSLQLDPASVLAAITSGELDPNATADGVPLLSHALEQNNLEVADALLKKGADKDAYVERSMLRTFTTTPQAPQLGMAPIHFAQSPEAVKLLASYGANLDAPYKYVDRAWGMTGETMLHSAALNTTRESLAIAEALISAGANPALPFSNKKYEYDKFSTLPDSERLRKEPISGTVTDRLQKLSLSFGGQTTDLQDKGSIKFNGREAVQVRYTAQLDEQSLFKSGEFEFVDAKGDTVDWASAQDPAEAARIIGAKNVEEVERQHHLDLNAATNVSGALAGANLAKEDIQFFDYQPNTIEPGDVQPELDDVVRERAKRMAQDRKVTQQRQVNDAVEKNEEQGLTTDGGSDKKAKMDGIDPKAMPDSVAKNFLKVEDRYYFKDQSIAFVDNGELLRARAEHKEVVKALVEIAEARGWDEITVRGSKAFRQAVWFEASSRGIEAKGYVPTAIDKAKLGEILKDSNVIEKGINKTPQQERSLDATPHEKNLAQGDALDTQTHEASKSQKLGEAALPSGVLRRAEGKLVEHGPAPYQFNDKKSMNYFVKIETPEGEEQVIWGVDLRRAMAEAAPVKGDKVTLDYHGSVAVTVKEPQYDQAGKFVGTVDVDTQRNEWRVSGNPARAVGDKDPAATAVKPTEKAAEAAPKQAAARASAPVDPKAHDKAKTFATDPAPEGVAKHPDLIGAYATKEAAKKFAAQHLGEHSEATQQAFVAAVAAAMDTALKAGEVPPAPKVRTEKVQEVTGQQKAQVTQLKTKGKPSVTKGKAKAHDKEIDMER